MMRVLLGITWILAFDWCRSQALEPIPDRLVVLTFDDSSNSHFTLTRR